MSRPKKELTYIDKAFHYPVISRYTSHIFSYHFHNTISGTQIHHQLWIRNNIHIFFTLADIEAFVYSGMYPPLKLLRLHTIKKPKPLSFLVIHKITSDLTSLLQDTKLYSWLVFVKHQITSCGLRILQLSARLTIVGEKND